jgi:hypothetical protein
MAKTIGQLTQATTIGGADELVIEQSGLTKRVAASVVRGGLVNADIDAAAAIAGSKLADDAITTAKIDDDAVTTAKIDDDAVTTAKIDDDAVTTAKIDDDAVTTAKILDANVTPAKLSQPLTLETAQATTSGTSIDFTGIPSWVKRITVMFSGVSTNGTSNLTIQIGAGSITTSGYVSCATSSSPVGLTTGFILTGGNQAGYTHSGIVSLATLGGDIWSESGSLNPNTANSVSVSGGTVTLSGTLDRIRITTAGGTDTFDAGSVNIMYEG